MITKMSMGKHFVFNVYGVLEKPVWSKKKNIWYKTTGHRLNDEKIIWFLISIQWNFLLDHEYIQILSKEFPRIILSSISTETLICHFSAKTRRKFR